MPRRHAARDVALPQNYPNLVERRCSERMPYLLTMHGRAATAAEPWPGTTLQNRNVSAPVPTLLLACSPTNHLLATPGTCSRPAQLSFSQPWP